ncbi:MAG TPA: hypothetical protein PK156_31980 [Polyangium sp.]|nr:hypothetical protein [Polyangium sp.]
MTYKQQLFLLVLSTWVVGCVEPAEEVFVASTNPQDPITGPDGPAPDQGGYQCSISDSSSCKGPQSRIWLPGWLVTAMAARGHKIAFSAYPTKPDGEPDLGAPQHAGQVDSITGKLEWHVPLATEYGDFYQNYDIAVTPQGDIVMAAKGYGNMLVGEGGYQFDGFLVSFDSSGNKRFGKRLEIWDTPPPPAERPEFVSATIIADDVVRVATGFYITLPGQPTYTAVHIFSFTPEGTQTYRKDVPFAPETYNTHTWPVADGSVWVHKFPGVAHHYSKAGEILDTLEIDKGIDMRGFVPIGPAFGLLNFTTKGMTNELHRFELGAPFELLFDEPTPPQFHAASFRQTLDLSTTYFYEMGYDGLSHRLSTIDAHGNRGPVATYLGMDSHFTRLDDGSAVFVRFVKGGTEFITQPL